MCRMAVLLLLTCVTTVVLCAPAAAAAKDEKQVASKRTASDLDNMLYNVERFRNFINSPVVCCCIHIQGKRQQCFECVCMCVSVQTQRARSVPDGRR